MLLKTWFWSVSNMHINIITKRIIFDFSFPEHIIPKGLVFAYTDNNIVTYWQVKWISGWAILGSKWKCCPQSSEAGKNQQAWGFDWVWQRTNYGKWEINNFFVFSVSTPAELYTTCLIPPFTHKHFTSKMIDVSESNLGFVSYLVASGWADTSR